MLLFDEIKYRWHPTFNFIFSMREGFDIKLTAYKYVHKATYISKITNTDWVIFVKPCMNIIEYKLQVLINILWTSHGKSCYHYLLVFLKVYCSCKSYHMGSAQGGISVGLSVVFIKCGLCAWYFFIWTFIAENMIHFITIKRPLNLWDEIKLIFISFY